jgi:hypothetical protein
MRGIHLRFFVIKFKWDTIVRKKHRKNRLGFFVETSMCDEFTIVVDFSLGSKQI